MAFQKLIPGRGVLLLQVATFQKLLPGTGTFVLENVAAAAAFQAAFAVNANVVVQEGARTA